MGAVQDVHTDKHHSRFSEKGAAYPPVFTVLLCFPYLTLDNGVKYIETLRSVTRVISDISLVTTY